MIRKIGAMLIAACLLLASAAGCATSGQPPAAPQTQASANSAAGAGASAGTSAEASSEAAAAADGAPVQLAIYTYWFPSTVVQSYDEVAGLTKLAELANVKIEWHTPSSGQNELEAFNIMLASGDYPDIIQHRWTDYPGGLQKLLSDGVIQPLQPFLDAGKAPSYNAYILENEDLWRQTSLSDGSIAHFAQLELNLKRLAYEGFFARGDWLESLGLEAPSTVDEFYAMLKAFKERDPNGNGQADEIPFAFDKNFTGIKALAPAWGALMDFNYAPGTTDVVFGPAQPEYRAFIETMAKWYAEGLLDTEGVSVDTKTLEAKFSSGTAGSMFGNVGEINTFLGYTKEAMPEFSIVPLPYLTGPAGKPYVYSRERVMYSGRRGAAISATCSDTDAALRYLDSFYNPETMDYAIWGIEGESYTVDADGSKHFTDKITNDPEGLPVVQALTRYAFPVWGWWKPLPFDVYNEIELGVNAPLGEEANKLWFESDRSILPPIIQLSDAESNEYANIMNEVNTFVLENTTKFMIGTTPLSEYDSYLATLESLKIGRATEILQGALSEYSGKTR
jgi:putative aldouronate transport system substrate-binding protein